ncbi:Beta-D-xylosidase [Melia azedarach]|uniref:Beta-D-xylosidase n=1 Tax=Melia azedarach TaxID=155640 RepID=A0ACC1XUG4_MELAZ|nr:Beta-D-xylosidase [Melia azedarach]
MRLGWFDGNPKYKSLGKSDICSQQNIELAAEAAREGIVLLKNDNNTLPLDNAVFKNLPLVGPHANATSAMIGNYAGIPCRYISPIDGFSAYGQLNYSKGCDNVACKNDSLISAAIEAVKNAYATVTLVRSDLSVEAESLDRVDYIFLVGLISLLLRIIAKSKTFCGQDILDKKVVVLLEMLSLENTILGEDCL